MQGTRGGWRQFSPVLFHPPPAAAENESVGGTECQTRWTLLDPDGGCGLREGGGRGNRRRTLPEDSGGMSCTPGLEGRGAPEEARVEEAGSEEKLP